MKKIFLLTLLALTISACALGPTADMGTDCTNVSHLIKGGLTCEREAYWTVNNINVEGEYDKYIFNNGAECVKWRETPEGKKILEPHYAKYGEGHEFRCGAARYSQELRQYTNGKLYIFSDGKNELGEGEYYRYDGRKGGQIRREVHPEPAHWRNMEWAEFLFTSKSAAEQFAKNLDIAHGIKYEHPQWESLSKIKVKRFYKKGDTPPGYENKELKASFWLILKYLLMSGTLL